MDWKIISDSSCDLKKKDIISDIVDFNTVPFAITIDGHEMVDTEDLNTGELFDRIEAAKTPGKTACPAPDAWMAELLEKGNNILFTISENLSGSFNSANTAKKLFEEEGKTGKVAVINSRCTGPEVAMCIRKMVEWIESGMAYEEAVKKADALFDEIKTVFALCSFDNLVVNGRMGRLTGFIARKLGMWGIGIGSDEGRIVMRGKTRGTEGMLRVILEDMKERCFTGKEIVISHCQNLAAAEKLRDRLLEVWADARVTIMEARGLDGFYAERGGLIVAYL